MYPRRISKDNLSIRQIRHAQNCLTRSLRPARSYRDLLTDDGVHERTLAHVRFAHYGYDSATKAHFSDFGLKLKPIAPESFFSFSGAFLAGLRRGASAFGLRSRLCGLGFSSTSISTSSSTSISGTLNSLCSCA